MKTACGILAVAASMLLEAHGQAEQRAIEWSDSGDPRAASGGTAQGPVQSQGTQSSGQAAFDRVCKVCHGAEARGDLAPRLVPFSREYEELLAIVREGTGQMPPISARQLSDESVAQIATYLKSLSP